MTSWIKSLPPFFPEFDIVAEPWGLASCSEPFRENFSEIQKSLGVLVSGDEGFVTLASASKMRKELLEWFESSYVQNTLTIPFSEDRLIDAIAWQAKQDPEAVCLKILACLFPRQTLNALRQVPDIEDWNRATLPLLRPHTVGKNTVSDEVNKDKSVSHSNSSTPKTRQKKPRHPHVLRQAPVLKEWLKNVPSQEMLPVQKEKWNGLLKSSILSTKGAGDRAVDYWFEDVFLPALCGASRQDLERVVDLQSDHLRPALHHPAASFKNIWSYIRGMPTEDRQFLLGHVLPLSIDSSSWSFKDKMGFLQDLVEGTKEKPWAFEERVRFWKSLGGDMEEEGVFGGEHDLLQSDLVSAKTLLSKQGYPSVSESRPPKIP